MSGKNQAAAALARRKWDTLTKSKRAEHIAKMVAARQAARIARKKQNEMAG